MNIVKTKAFFPYELDDLRVFEIMHVLKSEENVRLDNSPFYVFGLSYSDSIELRDEAEGRFYVKTLSQSGNSTYRLKLPIGKEHGYFVDFWPIFRFYGCSYEGSGLGPRRLYSINVPRSASISIFYQELIRLEQTMGVSFEEAHCSDHHRSTIKS